jgi:hypothetical protein
MGPPLQKINYLYDRSLVSEPVGRESVAHPAFSIIPTIDLARYHLPRIQDYEYLFLKPAAGAL